MSDLHLMSCQANLSPTGLQGLILLAVYLAYAGCLQNASDLHLFSRDTGITTAKLHGLIQAMLSD